MGTDAVVHYRERSSMMQAEGFEIGGRNPVNTFLTNLIAHPYGESESAADSTIWPKPANSGETRFRPTSVQTL